MQTCFFCEAPRQKDRILWENDLLYCMLDNFPVSPGHGLLIPKRHVQDLAGLQDEEWVSYKAAIQESISVIEATDLRVLYQRFIEEAPNEVSVWFCRHALEHPRINTKPDAYNHGLNDGRAAGRTVDHLHWHIIPRFDGDMEDPRGGVRYVIPELGNYKTPRG